MGTADLLLSKICRKTPGARGSFSKSFPALVRLDKYCSEMDAVDDEEVFNAVAKRPCPVKVMHDWTETLLRTCRLYDHRGSDEQRRYYQRLQRHKELVIHLYMESGLTFFQWHYIYMNVTVELFMFQLKWKKIGFQPQEIAYATKLALDCFKARLPKQPESLFILYPYARDLIDLETYTFFE